MKPQKVPATPKPTPTEDDVLRRMLSTPPAPHKAKVLAQKKRKPTGS